MSGFPEIIFRKRNISKKTNCHFCSDAEMTVVFWHNCKLDSLNAPGMPVCLLGVYACPPVKDSKLPSLSTKKYKKLCENI